jgi:urease accessory protein
MMGVPVPQPELMIALSALVLGLAVALSVRTHLWLAGLIVAVFAIFHGYAHGQELPQAANPLAYGVGFVVATGGLHAIGIGIGTLTRWRSGAVAVRALGLAVSALGLIFLRAALTS